jgi:hypothetical protein
LPNGNKNHFELLKQKIVATMQQSYPGINSSISEWKGQEITNFQEELLIKVNAHISEKWFYNHIKKENKTLPRIDVLNLLSKYASYANWDDFVFKNGGASSASKPTPKSKANRYFVIVPLLVIGIMLLLFVFYKLVSNREYRFSFYDADTKEPITGCQIEIKILMENESPVNYLTDTTGSFTFKNSLRQVKLVANAPYYKTDTIVRTLKSFEKDQKLSLHANDYALMIHYFSEMNVDDWQKRRGKLERMIDDDAMIYQVLKGRENIGMELFNKWEFIDKLTIPSGSLKHIEILDTKLKNDKIVVLRFRINEKK